MMKLELGFYRGKRVLVTGHTGFKGSWLCVMLAHAGAEVIGYSSCSKEEVRLFDLCGIQSQITHIKGDVRDLAHILCVFREYRPEIVFHLAAQPIVRKSFQDPVETYSTNVMGTVNVLEAARQTPSVRSVLVVTTDKVYDNREWAWGYRENDPLDGYDPYSNSKSCAELVTHSYVRCFFSGKNAAVSTVRAGNVIGGGDFAQDRIIPDCIRAAIKGERIVVRNPDSTRPFQHVLEPLFAYLLIAEKQAENPELASCYNVGPEDQNCLKTGALVELFVRKWGEGLEWTVQPDGGPHEANYLKLDCSKLKAAFGWRPRWDLETAVEMLIEWTKAWVSGEDVRPVMDSQIETYLHWEEQ